MCIRDSSSTSQSPPTCSAQRRKPCWRASCWICLLYTSSREEGLNSLLEALDFPASSSYTYQGTDGELVVRNGYDTLRVSAQGTVRYHTTEGEISRYPVASDTGGTGCYEAVEACRVLVSETLGTPVSYTHLWVPPETAP